MIDPAKFIGPLGDDSPSGPNLEYDADFLALERAQQGRPEQVIGDSVKPAEEPDWRDIVERAETLMGRTRDLRVTVAFTGAVLRTQGFEDFAAGLTIIKMLLETQWDSVHPQLDADDDNDPTLRMNSLLSLASPDGLLKALREVSVVQSRSVGRFSLRDIRIASGKLPVPTSMTDPPKPVQIDAAFRDAELDALSATAAQISIALENVVAVDRLLVDKVGPLAPELKPLVLDLHDLKHVFAEKLAARGVGTADVAGAASGADGVVKNSSSSGEVNTREDVVLILDRVCDYYARHEPSSPVPLLLRRAKRLVSKNFLEIIRDMTPGGVAEAELLGGIEKLNE